jgi:DNA-binding MarR family transcriptional regulator
MTPQNDNSIREILQHLVRGFGLLQKEGSQCCGITVLQSHILYEIGKRPSLSLNDLAELLAVETSTVSRQVNSLVNLGLVNRVPDPRDRRYVVLSLTGEGEQKREEISLQMNDYVEEVFQHIPQEKHAQVIDSLQIFAAAMREPVQSACCAPTAPPKK